MNNLATNIKDVGNKANHELPHVTEQMPEFFKEPPKELEDQSS